MVISQNTDLSFMFWFITSAVGCFLCRKGEAPGPTVGGVLSIHSDLRQYDHFYLGHTTGTADAQAVSHLEVRTK